MEDHVDRQIAEGRLVRVLDDWCPAFSGYHLYYPSRRQPSAAFSVLVDALLYKSQASKKR
jgi:DNA-binding transcriptional LysR family regulator